MDRVFGRHNSRSIVEKRIKDIKRTTRRRFNTEEKIRIVLEGIKGETSIAELCRREGIVKNNYYRWSKGLLDVGKRCLKSDTLREANSYQVKDLKMEIVIKIKPKNKHHF